MNTYVSRGLWTVLLTGGFLALGAGVAHADSGTSGENGIASGTQGILGIELPVQLGGNAISILGDTDSSGATTGAPAGDAASSGGTSGSGSLLGGTQLLTELGVPVTLGGNAISVLGDASSSGAGTVSGESSTGGQEGSTSGTAGLLGGTQLLAELGVPVTLGGNAISVLGNASTTGSTTDAVDPTDPGTDPTDPGTDPGDGGDLPSFALAADDVTGLAATGAEGGATAFGLAAILLAAGIALVGRRVARRR